MQESKYKKILNVVAQQARLAAYELSRLNKRRRVIETELSSIEDMICEYNKGCLAASSTNRTVAEQSTASFVSINQLTSVHYEIERLKQQSSDLKKRHEQNELVRIQWQVVYQERHAKESALEKLMERQAVLEEENVLKQEIVELAEYSVIQRSETH